MMYTPPQADEPSPATPPWIQFDASGARIGKDMPDISAADRRADVEAWLKELATARAAAKAAASLSVERGHAKIRAHGARNALAALAAFGSEPPSLRDYRNKAKRTRDSLPARFYRMIEGEEWDGEAHSYSKARKKYRRWEEPYQQRERERQQRKKRDYSKKKRPADDNARRQARRIAQREREKATLAASASAHGQEGGGGGALTEGGLRTNASQKQRRSALSG